MTSFRQEVATMEITMIPTSTLAAACAPTVGGYLAAVAPTGGSGAHQAQSQQFHQLPLGVTEASAGLAARRLVGAERAQVAQAWLRHRGASVVTATNGINSSEGSVRTTIPTVKKPFMDAASGVPPRGRPV
ncbi:hypothetical protein O7608_29630 [Solwaraspora sp. WMMA2056]|uniref:hypothetical protein n=1 Tax=Solwaraspora sp. WMMA2056 TaxID=3015161 RepID=UPI00259BD65B|nr:hypothetical protein [Solwaraspora sp. WMMA2056]WJK40506.1 hypothetical protein O7608_29630 [Solwaraspora sp. WMMA2056]